MCSGAGVQRAVHSCSCCASALSLFVVLSHTIILVTYSTSSTRCFVPDVQQHAYDHDSTASTLHWYVLHSVFGLRTREQVWNNTSARIIFVHFWRVQAPSDVSIQPNNELLCAFSFRYRTVGCFFLHSITIGRATGTIKQFPKYFRVLGYLEKMWVPEYPGVSIAILGG